MSSSRSRPKAPNFFDNSGTTLKNLVWVPPPYPQKLSHNYFSTIANVQILQWTLENYL